MRLIDFSARQIPPDQIKSAGYAGVVVYVSESRPGTNFGAKPITREYADALKAAGLHVVSNFQYGKPGGSVPSDYTRGYEGGVTDAQTAKRLHEAAGGSDSAPIFFSIDEDIDRERWNTVAVEWFRGINSVLGVERTGIYGHSQACAWALEDGVVGRSTSPGRGWVWQTRAWSCGEREPAAVLYQDVIDTASNPGPEISGTRVDVNAVLASDFGQWDLDRRASRAAVTPPDFHECTEIRSPYCAPRDGVDVSWFVLHTEDGYSRSARNLANYLSNNDNQASYHYTVDNDGELYNIVDTENYANSVFQPGNSKSINLAFAGSWANWSRLTWFDNMQRGIDVAAYIAARDTRRYGLQTRVISPEEAQQGQTGITDHNGVRIATGVGDHTDIGSGFPWDYFRQKLSEYSSEITPRSVTVKNLAPIFPDFPGAPIAQGAKGRDVIQIQDRLNTVGAAGLLVDGEFAPLTGRAVTAFQKSRGLVADGAVGPQTWTELFGGHRITEEGVTARALEAPPREMTGPGITTSVAMDAADLGILRWDPDRQAIAAMFGDNFEFVPMTGEWQSPSIVMYDTNYSVLGIPALNGAVPTILPNARRRQLWPYQHNNPEYSTILPCDYIRLGDWWHVAVMVTRGLGNELRTEFHRSRDLVNWEVQPELSLPHRDGSGRFIGHPGNIMLTFDRIGEYVYIFGTGGLARDRGIWMWRNLASQFPGGWWEPWGWDGTRWGWGIPNEATPILEGQFGELSFRYLQGNCVLSYFDRAGYKQQARTVQSPEGDWRDGANVLDYAFGWEIPQLYGGYISPLSRLNDWNGMQFWVSQWNTQTNDPYRVLLVQGTLGARGPLQELPERSALPQIRGTTSQLERAIAPQDPDHYPLPAGHYWGPLDGPEESWSNLAGIEPQSSKDGLMRWQEAIGVPVSGVYDNATKEAAARLQTLRGWRPATGTVSEREWDAVIREGTRLPVPETSAPGEVQSPTGYDIEWHSGPGFSEGHGAYLRIYLHTTENQDWVTSAEDVAAYQTRTKDDPVRAGSYHYLIDDDHIINTVATKHTAWGLKKDNPVSVQIAMVGTSGAIGCWGCQSRSEENPNAERQPKTREQWLAHDNMLDMVAFTIATVAKEYNIPIEWLDVEGVGANRSGVSSHCNYSYGSVLLYGEQDTFHWDVPHTFPHDVVLDLAKRYAQTISASDRFPLPAGHYWGPLDGPVESWSNTYGGEPESSKNGLMRWQQAIGVALSGVYDNATKVAASRLQRNKGWPVTGQVAEREWDEVIRNGWQLLTREALPPAPQVDPGPAVDFPVKIKDATGPGGLTDQFGMAATDLGVMARTPSGRIIAVFGDTFRDPWFGSDDWRAPVALFSDTKNLDAGIVWDEAAGPDHRYARQLWPYSHSPYSTVLPSDILTVGDSMYLHVMGNLGEFSNVAFTEIWKSTDDGHTWFRPGPQLWDPGRHGGRAQLWTWDVGDDGWVYVLSTGFQRDKPVILRRVPAEPGKIIDWDAYEGWGIGPDGRWCWGNEPTPVLDGPGYDRFGEMCLRRIQGQWVFVAFIDGEPGRIDVRVFPDFDNTNLFDVPQLSPIHGTPWGAEGPDAVAQLYGPSIVPGSRLDGGFHILISQWHNLRGQDNRWPYHAMQFKIPVPAPRAMPPLESGARGHSTASPRATNDGRPGRARTRSASMTATHSVKGKNKSS